MAGPGTARLEADGEPVLVARIAQLALDHALGICALRPSAAYRDHQGELEEYGFRRGLAYDLMQLSPDATTPGQTFLVSPQAGTTPTTDIQTVAPYVCTGTIDMLRVSGGGQFAVSSPFPLEELYHHLDSRFDLYNAPVAACKASSARPDVNIKQYVFDQGGVAWMQGAPAGKSASASLAEGRRWTVAGPDETLGMAPVLPCGCSPGLAAARRMRYAVGLCDRRREGQDDSSGRDASGRAAPGARRATAAFAAAPGPARLARRRARPASRA